MRRSAAGNAASRWNRSRRQMGSQNGSQLPEEKKSPEEIAERVEAIVAQQEISAQADGDADTKSNEAPQHASDNGAYEAQLGGNTVQSIAKHPPAQTHHEPDLLANSWECVYLSHESSSSDLRTAPSCPTAARKICRGSAAYPLQSSHPQRRERRHATPQASLGPRCGPC